MDTMLRQNHAVALRRSRPFKDFGLPTSEHSRLVKTIEEVIDFWQTWEARRDTLPFEIDGVVVKVNSLAGSNANLDLTSAHRVGRSPANFLLARRTTLLNDVSFPSWQNWRADTCRRT